MFFAQNLRRALKDGARRDFAKSSAEKFLRFRVVTRKSPQKTCPALLKACVVGKY